MKIIDNKKDYYDYLASIYGIDELVVYDRRGSVTLNSDKVLLHGMEYYFSNRILFQDKPLSDKQYWNLRSIAKQREAKDFGKVMGLLSKDVLDDFLKEHGGSYSALDKCEQKSLNKELNKLCTTLVKQVYMSQAYIIE